MTIVDIESLTVISILGTIIIGSHLTYHWLVKTKRMEPIENYNKERFCRLCGHHIWDNWFYRQDYEVFNLKTNCGAEGGIRIWQEHEHYRCSIANPTKTLARFPKR